MTITPELEKRDMGDEPSSDASVSASPAADGSLRHYARRSERDGGATMEIVDREFDFVRCLLPYDYAYTSNAQQWHEAELICRALEGPMSALGIACIAPSAAGQSLTSKSEDGSSQQEAINHITKDQG